MRIQAEKRRGIVAVIVAVSLVAVLSVVAIAIDGGVLLDDNRKVQAATDAAALAAACELFDRLASGGAGLDSSGKANASALSTAAANGFNNDGVHSVVTVHIPPVSGNFIGKAGYAEVLIQYNQKRGFSSIFGSSDLQVTARAVARGIPGDVGILILDPNLTVAAQICGTINIKNNGQIYCNSDSTVLNSEFKGYGYVGGVYLESTATLTCGGINVVGKLSQEVGSSLTYTNGGGLKTGGGPWPDPLASIPEPVVPSGTGASPSISSNTTINPGLYSKISVKSGTLTMNPGIYYITGGISMNGGSIVGNGVMIYNTSGDSLDFSNADSVYLTPPTSGTYRGISIFEPRSETKEVHIKCSGPLTIAGTLYAAAGEFDLRPNNGAVFNCGNYICDQAEWAQGYKIGSTNSNGTINLNPSTAAPTQRPMLVE